MRHWVLTYNAMLPIYIICGTFLILSAMGAFLLEFGNEDERFNGMLAVGFSILGLGSTLIMLYRFSRKRKAFMQLREISRMFEREKPRKMTEKLQELIASNRIGEMHDVLYFLLARAYQISDDVESAKKMYKIAGNFWLARNNLAVILLEEQDFEGAVNELRKAISLNPTEAILYHQLAWTLQRMDEPVLARKVLETAQAHVLHLKLIKANIERVLDDEEVEIPAMPSRVSFFRF